MPVKLFLIISIIFLLTSCREKPPIPQDTLVKIYADLVIARDTTENAAAKGAEINKEVFRKYNVRQQDYDGAIKNLSDDPEQWEAFFNSVIKYVEDLQLKQRGQQRKG